MTKKKKTILVGITGGIAAGKSTVAHSLQSAGYPILSADILAREVCSIGSPALEEIRKTFGEESLLADGSMNRPYIRQKILHSETLRLQLNQITHPRIQALTTKYANELFDKGHEIVFYEAPLLFEAKSEKKMSAVLCVWADDSIRIQRIMDRDNCDRPSAQKMIDSQMPQEKKIALSTYSIENNGNPILLEKAIAEFLEKLQSLPA